MRKPVQNDLAKFNDLMDENRRLRGDVRRLRRAMRQALPYVLSPRIRSELKAALAPRRRKKP